MSTFDLIVLIVLLLQSFIGVFALLRWRKALRPGSSFPTALVVTHISLADAATVLWIVRLATEETAWGWAAFVVLLVGNGVGDLVLAGRWRLDQAMAGRWLRGWVGAAKGLLTPRRRLGTAHAAGAGVATVLVLVACILG